MTDYTKTTDFTSKDSLPSGDSGKIIRGAEFGTEFDNIQTAVNSKSNIENPSFTGNITVTGTVDGRDIAADGTKLDTIETSADVTDTANVTAAGAVMDSELTDITAVKALNQGVATTDSPTFAAVTSTGNVTVGGTVDGRDVAADGTKLDGIEAGATADQTAAQIKTAYESNADTNAFTDADHTKLDSIEASADVTDATNVTAAGALMDSEVTNLAQVKAFDSADYATAAQGTTADAALPKTGGAMTGAITTNSTFDGRNVATDGTKLDGIEALADVTDTANVTAAGALMDSELTSEASVKALNQGVATTDSPTFAGATVNGTVEFNGLSGTGAVTVTDILDQDDMSGNSATALATQQSIKAYVDSQVGTVDTLAEVLANGNATGGTNITFGDNDKAIFGAGDDLEIYHTSTGNHSIIEETGGGNLVVRTNGPHIEFDKGSTEYMARMLVDGAVELYYDSALKLATSSTGIDVTGSVVADSYDIGTLGALGSVATDRLFIATADGLGLQFDFDNSRIVPVGADGSTYNNNVSLGASGLEFKNLFLSGNATFGDNDKAIFGAGSDLQIYHDGNHSYIQDSGTGNLYLAGDTNVGITNSAGTEWKVKGTTDGAVELYYNNEQRLATTTTGIDITGIADASTLFRFGTDNSEIANNYLRFKSSGTGFFDHNTVGQAFNFRVSASSALDTTPLVVNSTGIDVTGTVTAGDSSANADLILTEGSTNTDARIRNSNGILEIDADLNNEFGNSSMMFAVDGVDKLKINNNGDISFYEDTGTTAKLFWDASAESLGIGTSSPSTFTGFTNLTIKGGSNGANLDFFNNSGARKGAIVLDSVNSLIAESTEQLVFKTGSSLAERMRIDSSGNVGIGTDSPRNDANFKTLQIGDSSTAASQLVLDDNDSSGPWRIISNLSLIINDDTDERMRIDSSGNLLVDTTNATLYSSTSETGINLATDGGLYVAADGTALPNFNRVGSDGDIMRFRKDGTTVGSIGAFSSGVAGISFVNPTYGGIRTADYRINPVNGSGANFDNSIDLGAGGTRFKDLYLSNEVIFGSSTGSIGVSGSYLAIGNASGLRFDDSLNRILPFNTETPTATNGTLDIGSSGGRFKDLYLAGGAYLGGTGSANKLDDYEEGTFTVTFPSGVTSPTYVIQDGSYVKIGKLVTFQIRIELSAGTANSSHIKIGGLPFTSTSASSYGGAFFNYSQGFITDIGARTMHIGANGTLISFYKTDGNSLAGTEVDDITGTILINGQYEVA